MTDRKELLDQANELGLEFQSNIPGDKLEVMIAEKLAANAEQSSNTNGDKPTNPNLRPRLNKSQRIKRAKDRALKLHIVTITNKDNRENDVMTTVSVSFENEFFGLGRDVPLDIPVEIEQALIDVIEATMITLHKDEIRAGRRTGNKVPVSVQKFAVSYGKPQEG